MDESDQSFVVVPWGQLRILPMVRIYGVVIHSHAKNAALRDSQKVHQGPGGKFDSKKRHRCLVVSHKAGIRLYVEKGSWFIKFSAL